METENWKSNQLRGGKIVIWLFGEITHARKNNSSHWLWETKKKRVSLDVKDLIELLVVSDNSAVDRRRR